jgi:hypothetical protein
VTVNLCCEKDAVLAFADFISVLFSWKFSVVVVECRDMDPNQGMTPEGFSQGGQGGLHPPFGQGGVPPPQFEYGPSGPHPFGPGAVRPPPFGQGAWGYGHTTSPFDYACWGYGHGNAVASPETVAVDDDGAEGNETRQHSSSPVECVASRKGKGKAGTSKAKGSNFSQDEDHIVVKSWMEAVQQQKRKIRRKVS